MINSNKIKTGTPVCCSVGKQFGIVDHMEGAESIKLNKDEKGQHHYIPLQWVTKVDDQLHIDRPGAQAMKEWTTEPGPAKPMKDARLSVMPAPGPKQNKSASQPHA